MADAMIKAEKAAKNAEGKKASEEGEEISESQRVTRPKNQMPPDLSDDLGGGQDAGEASRSGEGPCVQGDRL